MSEKIINWLQYGHNSPKRMNFQLIEEPSFDINLPPNEIQFSARMKKRYCERKLQQTSLNNFVPANVPGNNHNKENEGNLMQGSSNIEENVVYSEIVAPASNNTNMKQIEPHCGLPTNFEKASSV